MDFSKLKSRAGSNLSALTEKLQGMNTTAQKDERIYKPAFDPKKDGGYGYAVVRFLTPKAGDPLVKVISHAFKGATGSWYMERSRVTIGEEDPVSISNKAYWEKAEAEGNESLKKLVKERKRSTKYFANVYVVKDSVDPKNNGKVMIMEFGQQIFEKIQGALTPKFEDQKPFDPFDMWVGADFRIKMTGKEMPGRDGKNITVPNYETSDWGQIGEFKESDVERESIFNQTYDLSEFMKVKPFDELAKKFQAVVGEPYDALVKGADPASSVVDRVSQQAALHNQQAEPAAPSSLEPRQPAQQAAPEPTPVAVDVDDDVMAMFAQYQTQ